MTYSSPGVYVEEVPSSIKAIAGVSTSTPGFIGIVPDSIDIPAPNPDYDPTKDTDLTATPPTNPPSVKSAFAPLAAGEVKLCTNFSEFKKYFGDFSTYAGQRNLVHAVYGFFNNGGSRCYVVRVKAVSDITNAGVLLKFEAIDEIALVAAPGISDKNAWSEIVTHCKVKTQDRFAILDCQETVETAGALDTTLLDPSNAANVLPNNTDFAAVYFPWIQVFDPATKIADPKGTGMQCVPPSGHIAGIYARVDTQRGVHKAPANEPVMGALGMKYAISKAQQDGLNPQGVNCIRNLNGNNFVWGARTIGGDKNADLKYINVRRTLLFLRESIDEGTQWVVFEPNMPALWQKITRNITAFLTNVWRSGALFGTSPRKRSMSNATPRRTRRSCASSDRS